MIKGSTRQAANNNDEFLFGKPYADKIRSRKAKLNSNKRSSP